MIFLKYVKHTFHLQFFVNCVQPSCGMLCSCFSCTSLSAETPKDTELNAIKPDAAAMQHTILLN
jgi:hypothetical protein